LQLVFQVAFLDVVAALVVVFLLESPWLTNRSLQPKLGVIEGVHVVRDRLERRRGRWRSCHLPWGFVKVLKVAKQLFVVIQVVLELLEWLLLGLRNTSEGRRH